jgi:hypothetical protein
VASTGSKGDDSSDDLLDGPTLNGDPQIESRPCGGGRGPQPGGDESVEIGLGNLLENTDTGK